MRLDSQIYPVAGLGLDDTLYLDLHRVVPGTSRNGYGDVPCTIFYSSPPCRDKWGKCLSVLFLICSVPVCPIVARLFGECGGIWCVSDRLLLLFRISLISPIFQACYQSDGTYVQVVSVARPALEKRTGRTDARGSAESVDWPRPAWAVSLQRNHCPLTGHGSSDRDYWQYVPHCCAVYTLSYSRQWQGQGRNFGHGLTQNKEQLDGLLVSLQEHNGPTLWNRRTEGIDST